MKKIAGIAAVMAAVMLTACQNNVVNSDITESTSEITKTSDTEQSGNDSREESSTESLTKEEQRRNELFERAKTIQQGDTDWEMLEKLGDGYAYRLSRPFQSGHGAFQALFSLFLKHSCG